jgi:hypothetical protein
LNGKCWYIFWPFVIFYGHCVYFTAFWSSLWYFGIFFPIWNVWTKKNLATLVCERFSRFWWNAAHCARASRFRPLRPHEFHFSIHRRWLFPLHAWLVLCVLPRSTSPQKNTRIIFVERSSTIERYRHPPPPIWKWLSAGRALFLSQLRLPPRQHNWRFVNFPFTITILQLQFTSAI